jgi:hypothetical protein
LSWAAQAQHAQFSDKQQPPPDSLLERGKEEKKEQEQKLDERDGNEG